jgi:phosphoribosylamine--glycine ligase
VLAVTAIADTLEEARAKAYDNARRVRFEGVYYRSDIGANAMAVPA